ncbi:MAG: outer membrane protein assembly factor BamA [Nitrospiria bacterium]
MAKTWQLLTVLLITLFSFSNTASAKEKEIEIKSIEVKGNQRIDRMTIFSHLSVREGDFFSPEKVQSEIKNLYRTGFFDRVEVESEGLEGGLALFFIVHEKPFLMDVIFEGNENIEKDQLNEAVQIKTNTFLNKKAISGYVDKITAAYEAEAYYNASVIPVIQALPDNQAVVTFIINEGDQGYIRKIEIEGNTVFDAKKIRKQMETDTYFWLTSWITESGRYKKEQLSFDRERIKDLYLNNGYLNVEVSEPGVRLNEDKTEFDITIPIVEGEQFNIGAIDFDGGTVFETTELAGLTGSRTGEIFNRGQLRADIGKITDHYGEKGYIYANVVPDLRPNPEKRVVDVTFHVIEGEPVRVREIHISGNNKTRDKVIRREIRVNEQELINTKALRRSFQRLNNLNYFEDINLVPRRISPEWVDIDVEVKEKPTGTFSVGGGYSSVDKFVATFDVTMGNFLGKGQLLKFKVETGGRRDTYTLTFREPYLFDRELSGTVNFFNQTRDFGVYEEKRTGGDIILGKSFGEYVKGSFSYTVETLEITDVDTTLDTDGVTVITDPRVPQQVIDQKALGETLTSAVGFSLTRDTRDFFFDPREGGRNSISFEYAGTFLGGDNAYYKVIVDSSRFFPLWWDHVFSLHGRIGFAEGLDGKQIPVGERFFVGGINTVRGFDFGEAGPLGPSPAPGVLGEVIGGNKEAYFNIEYLIPLVKEAKVKLLLFYDYGAAFDEGERFDLDGMREAAGYGIRWISPVGPLRLEWGHNLDPRPGEPKRTVEFSIGSLF